MNEKINDIETLISRISHDIRSPVASALGLINVAEMEIKSDESKMYFKMIKESIKKLDNIIIDLTSTVNVTTVKRNSEIIHFNKMIQEQIINLRFGNYFDKIKFNVDVKQTKDFYSDQQFILSIVQNLIENSAKYIKNNKAESHIDIAVVEDNKRIEIKVADNGIGIDAELQDKVFNMFFRGTEMSNGSGLGLYIVKTAVEKLHGKIKLKSEKGNGTMFTIYLPDLINYNASHQLNS